MELKIVNNIPNAKITMGKTTDNTVIITIAEQTSLLGDVPLGATVKIGGREYIVLDHSKDTTAVITKDLWKDMEFDNDSGDYRTSAVRTALNTEFYNEVADAVGAENIIEHEVNLLAEDGTNKGVVSYSTEFPRGVCYVCGGGALGWDVCSYSRGVRPFLILDSSVSNFSVET